MNIIDCVIL